MKQKPWNLLLKAVLVGLAIGAAHAATPVLAHPDHQEASGDIISPRADEVKKVGLDEVDFGRSGAVSGVLVNRTSDILRDVRLLVRYDWRWTDERHPGDDSPARSVYFTVTSDVPALGTLPFRFSPSPPLPIRDDGYFAPSVEVARYTQVRYKKIIRPLQR
jgi:hypothetical protein